jgi:hypothetical protein
LLDPSSMINSFKFELRSMFTRPLKTTWIFFSLLPDNRNTLPNASLFPLYLFLNSIGITHEKVNVQKLEVSGTTTFIERLCEGQNEFLAVTQN